VRAVVEIPLGGRGRLMQRYIPRSPFGRYGFAVASVAVATALALWLRPIAPEGRHLLLLAVLVTGWVCGLRPALVAWGLATLAFEYDFTRPFDSLEIQIDDIPDFVVFVLVAGLMTTVSAARRRAEAALRDVRDGLEQRVRERTSELQQTTEGIQRAVAGAVAAEQRFADLVNSLEGIVWEADAGTLAFGFVNERAERILGYPVEDWLGVPTFWADHIHPEDRDRAVRLTQEAIAEQRNHELEYRMIAADGRVVWLRNLVTVVVEAGRATRLRGVMVDVSRRKRDEEGLRERADLLSLTHDAIFVRDLNSVVKYWNRAAEDLYGWTAAEAVGQVSHDLVHTVFPESLGQIEAEVVRNGRWEGELVQTKKDGAQLVVASRWSLQQDEHGAPVAVLETINDITAGKRAEEARQAHLLYVESIDRVVRALQGTNDPEHILSEGLEAARSIFDCDRAWLVYACDPDAGSWRVSTEVTRPGVACTVPPGSEQPVDRDVANMFRVVRESNTAVRFGPGSEHPLSADITDRFGIRSQMATAIYPKVGPPYLFAVHQCSQPREWTPEEANLFHQIGRRVADGLTIVTMFRTLRDSEARRAEAERIAHVGYWERDFETDRVTWSDETFRILGLTPRAGRVDFGTFQERVHPEDLPLLSRAMTAALVGGRYDIEYRVVRPDGEVRVAHCQGEVTRDETGRLRRMVGTMQDVTDRTNAEGALRESEERWRAVFENNPTMYFMVDATCTVLSVNPFGAEQLGYTVDELVGRSALSVFHEADRDAAQQQVAACLKEAGRVFSWELRKVRKDGSTLWVRETARAMSRAGSDPVVLVVCEDITQRKRAEAGLQFFKQAIDQAPDPIYWLSPAAGFRFVYANEAACRHFGRSAETLLQMSMPDVNPDYPIERCEQYWRELPRTKSSTVETLHRRDTGEIVLVEVTWNYVVFDGREYIAATIRDITDRKRSEERRLAHHAVTQILAEAATLDEAAPRVLQAVCECLAWDLGALWRPDRQARVLGCVAIWRKASLETPKFEAVTRDRTFMPGIGLPGGVWQSRQPAFVPDVARDPNFRRGSVAAGEGLRSAIAFPILLADDVLGIMEFFSREERAPDADLLATMATIGGHIGQFIQRKRAEDAVRQAQAELAHVTRVTTLGELAASIAHEINQPLAAIVTDATASLNWLAAPRPNLDRVRGALDAIVADGHRAGEVMQRIRQLATNSAPRKHRLDIDEVVRDVVPLVRAELGRQDVALALDLAAGLPPVLGDRIQLQQVLLNLVLNAIEAMTAVTDRPRELLIRSRLHEGGHVLVTVQDTGVGLDSSNLDQLFTAFFTTKAAGMGMGLSISRSIVEAHGGRIWATPGATRGATFHFSLPIDRSVDGLPRASDGGGSGETTLERTVAEPMDMGTVP
jgi:PAS domain S-box-containing protein